MQRFLGAGFDVAPGRGQIAREIDSTAITDLPDFTDTGTALVTDSVGRANGLYDMQLNTVTR